MVGELDISVPSHLYFVIRLSDSEFVQSLINTPTCPLIIAIRERGRVRAGQASQGPSRSHDDGEDLGKSVRLREASWNPFCHSRTTLSPIFAIDCGSSSCMQRLPYCIEGAAVGHRKGTLPGVINFHVCRQVLLPLETLR